MLRGHPPGQKGGLIREHAAVQTLKHKLDFLPVKVVELLESLFSAFHILDFIRKN